MYPGVFPNSAGYYGQIARYGLVHLDADQYWTTRQSLEFFYPRLESSGVIILDDYGWSNCPGVKRALDEFVSQEFKVLSRFTDDYISATDVVIKTGQHQVILVKP